jgi:outer membrane protein TolC
MRLKFSIALLCLGLGGCTMRSEPFTFQENAERVLADAASLDHFSPPPTGPITLEEAQARAIAYNLDTRLQMFNAALQDRQLDLTKLDMLPSLTANAGYVGRDRELVGSSASFESGVIAPSNFRTVSVDRERHFGDLTLSWNAIDLGMSYLQARQQADRVQIAKEQRRRVVNNVFQQVRSAYWTALAAERVRPKLRDVLSEARAALSASRALEAERAQQPGVSLRYQRTLLELILEIEAVEEKLAVSKLQLAQLMGLRPGTSYRLAASTRSGMVPLRLNVDQLEQVALLNRPELREEGYNTRISQQEGRRALLRLMPGVNVLASLNNDSNSYLLYNDWKEAAVRVTASLTKLWTIPYVMKLNEAQADIAATRRLGMTMAVLAQVHISAQQYIIARKNFERGRSIAEVSRKIANISANTQEAQTSSDLDLIFDRANAALSELRSNRAYADLQNADASIHVTLGLDPLPEGLESGDLNTLVAAIREQSVALHSGKFLQTKLPVEASVVEQPSSVSKVAQSSQQ